MRSIVIPLIEDGRETIDMLDSFRSWLTFRNDPKSWRQLQSEMDAGDSTLPNHKNHEVVHPPPLPKNIEAYIRSGFERAEGLDRYAEREICRCFGVDNLNLLVRRSSTGSAASGKLSIPRKADSGMVRYDLRLHEDVIGFSGTIGGDESLSNAVAISKLNDEAEYLGGLAILDDMDDHSLGFSLARIAEEIFKSLLEPLHRKAFYLPADRTGIMHSHQVVVGTLLQGAATAGLRPSASIPILSGVLADFLSRLIELSEERDGLRSGASRNLARVSETLAKRLENDVLRGTIEIGSVGGGYPNFSYRPDGWAELLPLMRASSMVSELAPVVLYLRHFVSPGDVLVIEEPESNLHPAMQVAFTRQLAALVRAGIRVIVTTHSEWLLQELANLVRASQLSEAERAGIAGGEVALDPSQVGAWLFKPDATEEGSTVTEVGLDESGRYPSDFEDVAVAMHNDWAEISSRLGEDG